MNCRSITLFTVRKLHTAFPRCQKAVTVEMPPLQYDVPKYEGPDYTWITETRRQNINPALRTYFNKPLLLDRGYMQWLFDHRGRRYLDFIGGIVTVSAGHCHPKITKAAKEQLDKLWHCSNVFLHPSIHEYADRLTKKFPGDLKVVYFVNSGSEANELAILMARLYTNRNEIISFRNGYHGGSMATMALTALSNWKFNHSQFPGIIHVMHPDTYNGPIGGYRDSVSQSPRAIESSLIDGVCSSTHFYIDQLKEALTYSVSDGAPAAFFTEMIQGAGGVVQYPIGYMKKAYDLIRSTGGLCVADEVQTGFGRTGDHFWGFESHGVIPDIVTLAKGIGNGYPMGAVVTTTEIAKTMTAALHFNTFGGNPLASKIGLAVLDAIEEDNLQENTKQIGTALLEGLVQLRTKYEIIGDVRGKGLMIGMEMVEDRNTRAPLNNEKFQEIWASCLDMGLVVGKGGRFGNVFRLKPPMCISMDDVKFAIAVIDTALDKYS